MLTRAYEKNTLLSKREILLRENIKSKKGVHILADFFECKESISLMLNSELLKEKCRDFVKESGLTEIGHLFHQFPGSGVTGVVLLAESHFAIHTWPEKNYLTLDIFVCNFYSENTLKAKKLYEFLREAFSPRQVNLQEIDRD